MNMKIPGGSVIRLAVLSSVICILFCFSDASGFSVPERLQYDLTWTGVKAGEAVLEVKDDGPNIQFISKATSAKWVSVFYRVEDIVVSTLKKGGNKDFHEKFIGAPYNYRLKIREGRHVRDKELTFDHTARKVTYINHIDKETVEAEVNNSTFDALSSFYFARTVPLEVGKSVYIDVYDSKKLYKVEVQVLKKETIETELGTFKTILIKPIMKSEGIFYKKGDILIWVTDDEKRLPVLIKTKVLVGNIKATLVGGLY